jgi:mRNA-degrading endonuclease YafQ of YafQ-DinJ toxin-antitoxin module
MKIAEVTTTILEELERYVVNDALIWEDYDNVLCESVGIVICQIFAKLNKKHLNNSRVQDALARFLEVKGKDPQTSYGGNDYPMTGKGPLRGIKHAKLTNDISIMYETKNNTIYLFAIGSHDDLGFGRPNNIKKQKQLVKKIDACKKSEGI